MWICIKVVFIISLFYNTRPLYQRFIFLTEFAGGKGNTLFFSMCFSVTPSVDLMIKCSM